MELTNGDIDQLIRSFRIKPTMDTFMTVKNWYEDNLNYYPDQEYMVCVYVFLLGANIKNRFENFSYDQHRDFIKEIRDTIELADPLVRPRRKAYLDYGTK